jgi:hypothetical protein
MLHAVALGSGGKCQQHVGDMLATWKNVSNFRSDIPIPTTCFSCVGTLLCRDFSGIDVPRTDNVVVRAGRTKDWFSSCAGQKGRKKIRLWY